MKRINQICSNCVMDSTDTEIKFDENGVCNHCKYYYEVKKIKLFSNDEGKKKLNAIMDEVKKNRNSDYDSIIGVSGGVDSSYTAYLAYQYGLHPLVIHVDNGWNSEISVRNIENIVEKFGFDLLTHVIDWNEFKDLQISFMKASVVDIELLTDHAIMAKMVKAALTYKIKYILLGTNFKTEGIKPRTWAFSKWDSKNIKAIQKKFGGKKIRTYPTYNYFWVKFLETIGKLHFISILNFIDYNKKNAMETLEKEVGWKYYGGKHFESFFTKFYQAYILPKKFNIDKRKCHLSTLICSGQITRENALMELNKPLYDDNELRLDKEYILKKFEMSDAEFEEIMNLPIKSHLDYPNSQWLFNMLFKIRNSITKK